MRKFVPFLALPFLISLFVPMISAQDRIDLKTGRPLAGVKVESENYKEVTYQPKGANVSRKIAADTVLDVYRDGAPAPYTQGRGALASGDIKNAVRLLELAASESGKDKWVAEYANFYLGRAALRAGDAAKARQAFEKVLSLNGESRFLPEVRVGIIHSSIVGGNFAQAQTDAAQFVTEVGAKKLPTRYRLEAKLFEAKSFEGQNRFVEAAGAYKRVAGDAQSEAGKATDEGEKADLLGVAVKAQAAAGSALIRGGDFTQADSIFSQLRSSFAKDNRAIALADIGKAEAAMGRGDLDDARIDATRVIAISTEQDVRPQAYLVLGRVYLALAQKGESNAGSLARSYLEELIEIHPGAPESVEAQKLLAGIK